MLAVAFVGPLGAFLIPIVAELCTWLVRRDRLISLPMNLAATAVPSLLAALAFQALAGELDDGSARDLAALTVVAAGFLVVNFLLLHTLAMLVDGGRLRVALRPPRVLLPSLALTIALTVAIAGTYARYGIEASLFVVLIIVAFTYMSRLVVIAHERTASTRRVVGGAVGARALAGSA